MPPVTKTLLIVNVAVFIAQQFTGDELILWFGLWPLTTGRSEERRVGKECRL